jgi:hypothetical protein
VIRRFTTPVCDPVFREWLPDGDDECYSASQVDPAAAAESFRLGSVVRESLERTDPRWFHSNRAEGSVMTIQLRSGRFRAAQEAPGSRERRPAVAAGLGRLIPVALALYLIPALLVVLIVGGIGMLVLAVARLVTVVLRGLTGWPRTPVGPSSFSS